MQASGRRARRCAAIGPGDLGRDEAPSPCGRRRASPRQVVTGTKSAGETLDHAYGFWNGTGPLDVRIPLAALRRRRRRAVVDISGATRADLRRSRTPTWTAPVRSVVTASNSAGTAFTPSVTTTAIAPAPPVNTVAPAITGTPADATTLTADPGTWGGTPTLTYAYRWQRCDALGAGCADIGGATGSSYQLTQADVDATIRLVVTATNAAGSASETTTPTTAVAPTAPVNAVAPVATGTLQEGQTLTAATAPGRARRPWPTPTGGSAATPPAPPARTSGRGRGHVRARSCGRGRVAARGRDGDQRCGSRLRALGQARAVVAAPAVAPAAEVTGGPPSAPRWSPTPAPGRATSPPRSATVAALRRGGRRLRGDRRRRRPQLLAGGTRRGVRLRVRVTAHERRQPAHPHPPTAVVAAGAAPAAAVPAVPAVCRQLAGNARYRRVKVRGVGTVRVRAYAASATAATSPIRVTTQITERPRQAGRLPARRVRLVQKIDAAARDIDHARSRSPALGHHVLPHRSNQAARAARAWCGWSCRRSPTRTQHRPALTDDRRRRSTPARRRPLADRRAALRGPRSAAAGDGARGSRWVGFLRVLPDRTAKPRRLD